MNRFDAEIRNYTEKGHGPGSFECVLSVPTKDRDGEIIDARAFEPLPSHIPIDVDHAFSARGTVGSGRPYYDGPQLKLAGRFASTPLGQEIRTLVVEGHVRKMSVAFTGAVRERDKKTGLTHVRRAELINAAIVAIPSNREADILTAKAGARMSPSEAKRFADRVLSELIRDDLREAEAYLEGLRSEDGPAARYVNNLLRSI